MRAASSTTGWAAIGRSTSSRWSRLWPGRPRLWLRGRVATASASASGASVRGSRSRLPALRHFPPDRGRCQDDEYRRDTSEHAQVQQNLWRREIRAGDHDLAQAVDGVGDRQDSGDRLEQIRQPFDRPEEAAEQTLRHDHDRDELQDLELCSGEGCQEDAQRNRTQSQHQDQQIRDQRVAGGVDAEADGERRDGAQRRDIQSAEDEGEDDGHLQRREETEAEAVAEHDFGSTHRGGEQAFERASNPLAQEADAGQDENEEVGKEADHDRSERVQLGCVRRAVHGRSLDGGQGGAGRVRHRAQQGFLDGREHWSLTGGIETQSGQVDLAILKAEVSRDDNDKVDLLVLEHLPSGRVVRDRSIDGDAGLAFEGRLEPDDEGTAAGNRRVVDDGDSRGRGLLAAQDPAEQGDDGQRSQEEESQRAGVATELGNDAAEDRGHAKRVHRVVSWDCVPGVAAAESVANRRNAVSMLSVPARLRSSADVPWASTRPSRMKSSSSQRSASSMTWLETRSVAPSAASRWKWSQNCTRNAGSTPTVGSSRKITVGWWARAQAIDRRRRIPPERFWAGVFVRVSSSTSSSAA